MAKPQEKQRKQQYPMMRGQATFRPETVDLENRTVEIVFTTGQAGKRYDWWDDAAYIEELEVSDKAIRSERLDKGLSIIDSHNRYKGISGVLGITEEWRIEKGQLIGTARFSKNQQAIFDDVVDGILRHVSLGYITHAVRVTSATKDALETRTAIDWEPTELSIVPVSFETENGTRSVERSQEATYAIQFIYEEERAMTEEEKRALAAAKLQEQQEAERAQAPDASVIAAEARGQLPAFLDATRAAGLSDDVAIEAFTRGDTIEAHRTAVLAKLAETRAAGSVKGHAQSFKSDNRQDHGESFVRDASEYLQHRTSKRHGAKLSDGARNFVGMTLFDMAREMLIAKGERVYGMNPHKIAERAMHTTSDFSLILSNVMNKNLLAAYDETPRTFLGIAQKATLNDFRDKHTYRLGDAPDLLPLNEHGEYQGGTISESGEKYRLSTFARKISFTRQALINDDMGALDLVPRMFGAAGSRLESDIVWGLLANYDFINGKAANHVMSDNKPLFDSTHKNKETTGSALSKTSLNKLRKLGRNQKTLDGKHMNIMFDHLAVPPTLETTAEDLVMPSIFAAKIDDQAPRVNLKLIVEPRLEDVSSAYWYAFASSVPTIEYANLAGEEDLYTEVVHGTDIDGMVMKVRKDFGAGLVDWRGAAMATGAS